MLTTHITIKHSLGSTYYFPDRVRAIIGDYTDNKDAARLLKAEVDAGNKAAKAVRQDGKPVTFGLSYGSYPPKVAATIKCSLQEAESIFHAYHNEMYPTITQMREDALAQARQQGYLHLGLGCRIYSDDIEKDSRTLFNALSQFWSVLTLIAVNELHHHIDEEERDDIVINSTIYDAIYGLVRADTESIRWLNDHIVPIMTQDFLVDQIVHNECELEIGHSWSELTPIPNNATPEQIQEILDDTKE